MKEMNWPHGGDKYIRYIWVCVLLSTFLLFVGVGVGVGVGTGGKGPKPGYIGN